MGHIQSLCRHAILAAGVLAFLTACTHPGTHRPASSSGSGLSLPTREVLAVIGVKPEEGQRQGTDPEGRQNPRLGFGLNHLLAETLFDTGKFRLMEEKDVRQRDLLEDFVHTYWLAPRAPYAEHELHRAATQLGAALLAYGSISHRHSAGQRVAFGPFSHATQMLQIRAHVCLYDASNRITLCREGQGETQQAAGGVAYEFQGDRLDFEKSAAGKATAQAITQAVQKLTADIRFLP